jgi:hypothetical protein
MKNGKDYIFSCASKERNNSLVCTELAGKRAIFTETTNVLQKTAIFVKKISYEIYS